MITVSPEAEEFAEGTVVTLTAIPSEGWRLDEWQVNFDRRMSNPLEVTMNSDKSITGKFVKREYPLTITVEGEGSVIEEVIQAKSKNYPHGTLVKLTAQPDNIRWIFQHWEGYLTGSENPETIQVDTNLTVTSVFGERCCIRLYGGSNSDVGRFISQTHDQEGFVVGGETQSVDGDFIGTAGESDIFFIRTDTDGNAQQIQTYGGSGVDVGRDGVQTGDGGYVLTGSFESDEGDFNGLNRGGKDIFLMKVNSDGAVQWLETFGGSGSEEGMSVVHLLPGENGFVLSGWTNSSDGDFSGANGSTNIFLIKVNSDGEKEWVNVYGGSGLERAQALIHLPDQDGGFALTGWSHSIDGDFSGTGQKGDKIFLIRTDSDGSVEWIRTYGGSERDQAHTLTYLPGVGAFFLSGRSNSNDEDFSGMNKGLDDIFLIRTDAGGVLQWVKTYGGSGNDECFSVIPAGDGGLHLTGRAGSVDGDFSGLNEGQEDIFLLKVNINGQTDWIRTFGGPGNTDEGRSVVQAENGSLLLTGKTRSGDGDFNGLKKGGDDVFIIKLNDNGTLADP